MADTANTADGTLYSILYQIILACTIVGAFMIGYEILRQSRIGKYIYAPRLLLLPDQTPEVANGWFAWFTKNKKVDEEYVLRNNGVDAVMLLKLYRMGYQMFLYIGLYVLVFTLPINILFRNTDENIISIAEENDGFFKVNKTTTDNHNVAPNNNGLNDTQPIVDGNGNITNVQPYVDENGNANNNYDPNANANNYDPNANANGNNFEPNANANNYDPNANANTNNYDPNANANANNYDPTQPIANEGGIRALYHYVFGKRSIHIDVPEFDDENERNAYFMNEINNLINSERGIYQVDIGAEDNGDGNANGNDNGNGNGNDNGNGDGNANGNDDYNENGDENGNGTVNRDGDIDGEDKDGLMSGVTNIANNTISELKSFDIKKYIFFERLRRRKEKFSLFHLTAVYFVVGFICFKLYRIYQEYLDALEKYVKDGGIVQERNMLGEIIQHSTIMVRNIPPELQDDERLMNWFTKLGIGKIENVVIARSSNKIRKLVLQRTKILNNLEDDYVKWYENIRDKKTGENFIGERLKGVITDNTDDIGEKVFEDNDLFRPKTVIFKYKIIPVAYVDAIHYNEQQLLEYTRQIKELRLDAAQSRKWSQTAFITFSNHKSAKIAAQLILYSSRNPNVMSVSTAPHPNDLLYKNLNMRTERKTYRSIFIFIAMYFICFLLAVLVIATKYETLKQVCNKWFPFGKPVFDMIDNDPKLAGLFQSFFQVILLNIYTTGVPYILKFLSNFQGFETKSDYANSVLKKYYVFLVVMIIFSMAVSTLASKVIDPSNLKEVTNISNEVASSFFNINFNEFVKSLTGELAKNTITYFNYGILRLQSFGFEIFRIGAVVLYFVKKMLKKDTPRAQHLAKQMASPPDYCIILAVPLLCFTLFITFSVVNPFIPFIGTTFFYVGYHVMKNQFLYVYVKEFDSQGKFFVTCFNRIIFSLFLFEFFMFGYFLAVFSYARSAKWIPYLVLPTIIATYYFSKYCRKCFKPRVNNVPVDLLISKERKDKYTNQYQRQTIFGKSDSFISEYVEEESFMSCATHITSLDNKPNEEVLKMAEIQAPYLPPYYEAKSYNNPALTETLYSPWVSEEAQGLFTEAAVNNIADVCRECYRCDKESRFD